MRILVVTVAGMSIRFRHSIGKDCLKCLYPSDSLESSLLYRLLSMSNACDLYIIVGGYNFEELKKVMQRPPFFDFYDKSVLIENKHFSDYGSGYSLYLGILEAQKYNPEEILFAEGDIFVGKKKYQDVIFSSNSVITCNCEPILAERSVAFYQDVNKHIHYIYDTDHSALCINECFISIYNSGQIWKFSNKELFNSSFTSLSSDSWKGTNLIFVEKYFNLLKAEELQIINFPIWVNCNTIDDFRKIEILKEEEHERY